MSKDTTTLEEEIRTVLNRVHDREHKYFTTSYDGIVGVQDEDIEDILSLIQRYADEARIDELKLVPSYDDYVMRHFNEHIAYRIKQINHQEKI